MFRKYIFAAMALVFFCSTTPVFASFPDVSSMNPYYLDIARLQKLEFVKGDEQGNFNPDNGITRCEMAKLTWLVYESFLEKDSIVQDDGFPQGVFPDIPDGHWCDFEASRLKAFGIVKGTDKGNFEPDREVSAAEAFKMLLNAADVDFGNYDVESGEEWYMKFAGYVFRNKLEDYDSFQSIQVNKPIARKSVARVIKRLIDQEENLLYDHYTSSTFGPVQVAYPAAEYTINYSSGLDGYDDNFILFRAQEQIIHDGSIWGNDFRFRYVDKETLDYYMSVGGYSYHYYSRSHDEEDLECTVLGTKKINNLNLTEYTCPGFENFYGYYVLIGDKYFWAESSNPVRHQNPPFVESFEDIMSSVKKL